MDKRLFHIFSRFFYFWGGSQLIKKSARFKGGAQGAWAPLLVEYLQKIYKKTTEMSIQKPFQRILGLLFLEFYKL